MPSVREYEENPNIPDVLAPGETLTVTQLDIEKAVCTSEIAGSGHHAGMPCKWHTVNGNERMRRFVYALAHPEEFDAIDAAIEAEYGEA